MLLKIILYLVFFASSTDQKITLIALAAMGLYLTFCTCRYFYHNWKKIEDGQNKMVDFFGCVHEGEFKNGQLNGQGKREMLGGFAEGEFKDGKLNGRGKISDFMANEEGEYQDNKLNGQGKIIFHDMKKYLFFGPIVNGKSWEGEFKNGLLNGQGKRTWPLGGIEEGEFKNGRFIG